MNRQISFRELKLNGTYHFIAMIFIAVLLFQCGSNNASRMDHSPSEPSESAPLIEPISVSAADDDVFRVGLVQLNSSQAGDFEIMTQLAREAKEEGASLVVFPESSYFGWLNPQVFTSADNIPGEISSRYIEIAKEIQIWVATGLGERAPGSGVSPDIHNAYDSGILVNPEGEIVLHHRKYSVLKNAFDTDACEKLFGKEGCNYLPGSLSDISVVDTPFGRTAIIVCADAYTYDPSVLDELKSLAPDLVIVPWGIAAASEAECGTPGFNATQFAADAAKVLGTAYVVGANGTGQRRYGRYRPSWYCGTSGFATPSGEIGGVADTKQPVAIFDIPYSRAEKTE